MFGIKITKTVQDAFRIDNENNNAIQREMKNGRIAFKIEEKLTPQEARRKHNYIDFQEIKYHMIVSIKMDGKFTRKARFLA